MVVMLDVVVMMVVTVIEVGCRCDVDDDFGCDVVVVVEVKVVVGWLKWWWWW